MYKVEFLGNLPYVVKYPENYDETKKYPTVFFLHGSGSRGTNPLAMLKNDFFTVTAYLEEFDFVTVAPMCHEDSWFDLMQTLKAFVDEISGADFCDMRRFYAVGQSMGGYAVWQLAMSMPAYFAAIVPICGGGMYWNAARLKNVPIWAFHGALDNVVHPRESINMVEAVNACGGNAKLTIVEDVAHMVWCDVYENREVFNWLLGHRK